MLLLFSMLLLFQDDGQGHKNEDEHGHDPEQTSLFEPIVSGNVINVGSFIYEVPEGVFYADEENVHHMYHLAKTEYIPNCVGIFFSASGTWEYCVVIQHFPFQPFTLEPKMPTDQLEGLFKQRHLLYNKPHTGESQVLLPASYDDDAQFFQVGMRYDGAENYPIIMKKILATNQDALVVTVQAHDGSYASDREQIEAIMASPHINPDADIPAEPNAEPLSYLNLLGLKAKKEGPQQTAAAAEEGLPKSVMFTSGLLIVFALILFGIVIKVQKGQQAESAASAD